MTGVVKKHFQPSPMWQDGLKQVYASTEVIMGFCQYVHSNEKPSLSRATFLSRDSISQDPRDKVFALLGISRDGAELFPTPDYQQPLEFLLSNMTKKMIISSKSLDLLRFGSYFNFARLEMPSWTINWQDPNLPLEAHLISPNPFYKSYVGRCIDEIISHDNVFKAKGFVIGEVAALAPITGIQKAEIHDNTQNLTWGIAPNRICKLKNCSYYSSLDEAWLSLVLCLGGIDRFNSTETNPFFLKMLRGEPSKFCLPNLWPRFTSSLLYRRIFDRVTGSVPVLKPFINLCRGHYYVLPKSTCFYKKRIIALLKLNQDFAFYGIPLRGLRHHLTFAGDDTLLWLPSIIFCLLCVLLIGLGKVGILFALIGGTIFWLFLALTAYSSKMYVQSSSCLNAAYEQSSAEYLTTRGVLVFAEKGLLALAGEHVRKGDHICWLIGCTRPLIVRKVISGDGTRYHVVGEALVYPSDKDRRVNFVRLDSTFSAEVRTAWIEEKLARIIFQDIVLV